MQFKFDTSDFMQAYENRSVSHEQLKNCGFIEAEIEELTEKGLLREEAEHSYSLRFVGVMIPREPSQNTGILAIPKYLENSDWSSEKIQNHLGLILRSLYFYRFHSKSRKVEDDDDVMIPSPAQMGQGNPMALSKFFIDDYMSFGIYRRRTVEITKGEVGRIDWSRTIQKCVPIVTRAGPIYTDVIRRRRRVIEHDLITNFHRYMVENSIRQFGRILGFKIDKRISGNIANREMIERDIEKGEQSQIWHNLRKEMRSTFGGRDIKLLRNLMNVIKPTFAGSSDVIVMGTRKFENLWEDALRGYIDRLKTTEKMNKKFKRADWRDKKHKLIDGAPTGSFISDTIARISKEEKRWLVVDAKHYDLQFLKDPPRIEGKGPGIGDILKQWAYEKILRKEDSDAPILNLLVFPKIEEGTEGNVIVPFGSVGLPDLDADSRIINCFADPEIIMKNYITSHSASEDELNRLFDVGTVMKNAAIAACRAGSSEI